MKLEKDVSGRCELYDLECKHNLAIPSSYGKVVHVIIFMDASANTYAWSTASCGLEYEVGMIYDISAKLDETTNKLSYVKALKSREARGESEQKGSKTPVDVLDLIYGLD